jgi:undecaprenyl-diphosphatase
MAHVSWPYRACPLGVGIGTRILVFCFGRKATRMKSIRTRLDALRSRRCWFPELEVLIALLAVVGTAWIFFVLADEVIEGDTQRFDDWVISVLRDPANPRLPRGPGWLHEVGRDVTAIGGATVVTMVVGSAAMYLLLRRKSHAAWLMLLAIISGVIVSTVLKNLDGRERPPVGSDLTTVITYSFPSGHSMLSAVAYLVLGTMLARTESQRSVRIFFMTMAVLTTLLVGISRVYLGVHYPSDVLGGWTAGLCWAIIWWIIARVLQRKGKVEGTHTTTEEIEAVADPKGSAGASPSRPIGS